MCCHCVEASRIQRYIARHHPPPLVIPAQLRPFEIYHPGDITDYTSHLRYHRWTLCGRHQFYEVSYSEIVSFSYARDMSFADIVRSIALPYVQPIRCEFQPTLASTVRSRLATGFISCDSSGQEIAFQELVIDEPQSPLVTLPYFRTPSFGHTFWRNGL